MLAKSTVFMLEYAPLLHIMPKIMLA